eukprot:CAMPEP_0198319976 /NCGR_PEP_ID=MMETSP1450-20131203/8981_1 /TAXON_ID=753684 ORGANISM="Madagascaria erythrocladiodes, Strain CCMP3234" /NCGR_SAMPLE_ID=MMETSP1450 /ASSEMBLY_ACC=CAM_ASM_001115 /LENGTH=180 /DNA_ID=CAMNT_0044023403 /DNA_START=45 /DNA_END=583 /DNA_ORIENTATION=-
MGRFNVAGLTSTDAAASRKRHGSNALPPPQGETFLQKLWANFNDPLIRILCVGLVVIVVLALFGYAQWYESVGIAVAVTIATVVSTVADWKNESSFRQLQAQASKTNTRVFRDGILMEIAIDDVVVGDCVLLAAGDVIPADGVVTHGSIDVDQSTLTGEAASMKKVPFSFSTTTTTTTTT